MPVLSYIQISATKASKNSLPYVVLSEIYGLRDENLTIDLASLVTDAKKKNRVTPLPLSAEGLNVFLDKNYSGEKDFIVINYMEQFSDNYDPERFLNKMDINEKMFNRPTNTLWIFNEGNFGSGINFYRIKLRKDIVDLNSVILGKDVFVESLEAINEELEDAVLYDKNFRLLLTGYGKRTFQIFVNNYHAPETSGFAGVRVLTEKDIEDKSDLEDFAEDCEDIGNLGEFGGVVNGPLCVKKIEIEEYNPFAASENPFVGKDRLYDVDGEAKSQKDT